MSAAGEEGIVFDCRGCVLAGVLHRAQGERGVLVVVGGPQYRAGSHRQFTLLARRLAGAGVPVLRFDCRGHGDSEGARAGFEAIHDDIDAAVAAFLQRQPGLREIALWGLCDAASAMLLHPGPPAAVRGLALLNPWVTEQAPAPESVLRHYYLRRLLDRGFWRKLLRGGVRGGSSARELLATVAGAVRRRLRGGGPAADGGAADGSLASRMAAGLERFDGPVLIVTSGHDLVAAEFLDTARREPRWRSLLARRQVRHEHLPQANHTFASQAWRTRVEDLTLEWLRRW